MGLWVPNESVLTTAPGSRPIVEHASMVSSLVVLDNGSLRAIMCDGSSIVYPSINNRAEMTFTMDEQSSRLMT